MNQRRLYNTTVREYSYSYNHTYPTRGQDSEDPQKILQLLALQYGLMSTQYMMVFSAFQICPRMFCWNTCQMSYEC